MRFCGLIHMVGGIVVVMSKFEPERYLQLVDEHRITHSQLVPTMFVRMLKLPTETRARYDVSSLKAAIHAAAPCPVDVEVGIAYFDRDVMPFSYHNDPVKTREVQHPRHDNWATTGDIRHVHAEGYLYLTDRRGFMIISGGANVYPQEVENALTLHPAVYDVAVIGVPDDMGEVVKAVVQPADGFEPGPELERELIDHVRGRIAHVKAPRSVDFVDSLPRTPTGKLVKRKLRDSYLSAPS